MTANEKKTFVLDTNVILHDYRSIYNFTNKRNEEKGCTKDEESLRREPDVC